MQYVLSIDRGTTGIKAALYDLQANEIAVAVQPCQPVQSPHPGWCEQDMDLIWKHTALAVRQLLAQGYMPEQIVCIGCSGQGNGVFLADRDGRPLRPGIVSLDSRAEQISSSWNEAQLFSDLPEIGIDRCGSSNTAVILRWIKDNEPEVYRKIGKIFFSKDWVRFCLAVEYCTDYTDASGACLMDITRGVYSKTLFERCGLEELMELLPPVLNSYDIAGHITGRAARETGLLEGTPVVCGAHDIAAASLGVGGMEDGHLAIIFGTLGLNLAVEDTPYQHSGVNLYSILPGKWMSYTCLKSAGATLDRCVQTLFAAELQTYGKSFFAEADRQMEQLPPTQILFYPYLFGSNAAQAPCAAIGMEAWHSKYHLLLAIYQGLVYEFAKMAQPLRQSKTIREIWLIGGGANSSIFPQLFADVFSAEVHIAALKEATSRGVALCAIQGLHQENVLQRELICRVPQKKVYSPEKTRSDWYQKHFALYEQFLTPLTELRKHQGFEVQEIK